MTFAGLTFLVYFPLVFVLYWLVRDRVRQNLLLILASYFFYGWWDYRFCGLMIVSSLLDYAVGLGLERTDRRIARRALLWCSLVGNIGLLGVFKYFGFFADSLHQLGSTFGWDFNYGTLEIALPIGISFYTFQTLSYTIDVYKRTLKPTRNLVDYLAFVSFFPQLVAGPIERASNLLPQISRPRQFSYEESKDGLRLILWGLIKKLLIADRLAVIVNSAFAEPGKVGGPHLLLAACCFLCQIYCDFAAYSDIAIGTAKLFNIKLMRNFDYPLFAQSLTEFWRRWHISLTSWFRDYVFMPLAEGGSRRWALASLVLTFALSGLWHGAGWTYVIWGSLFGVALALENLLRSARSRRQTATPGGEHLIPRPRTLFNMLTTFSVASLLGVFFRAESLADAIGIFQSICSDAFSFQAYAALLDQIKSTETMLVTLIVLCVWILVEWTQRRHQHPFQFGRWPLALRWTIYSMALWGTLLLMPTVQVNPFIYFQF